MASEGSKNRATPPAMYLPLEQAWLASLTLMVRTEGEPLAVVPDVRRVVSGLDPEMALFGVGTLDQALASSLAQRRFVMTLLGLFAAMALALAAVLALTALVASAVPAARAAAVDPQVALRGE